MRLIEPCAGAVEAPDAFGDFLFADDERRQQSHDIVARGNRDHLFGPQRIDEFAGGHQRAQADQQPLAAHLGDHGWIAVLDFRQPLLEQ